MRDERLRHRNYLLGLLTVIYAFNQVDRFALGLVLQDIKLDLALSDTQLGFLGGIAFALFYSVMGIPIARWADRGNRVTIVSITTALWSVMVVLCGATANFVQLLIVRVLAAVGEAGCVPLGHSLIADYFAREERARAVARYTLGLPLSIVLGYFVAGWLNELYGWRVTFVLLGLPGIALGILAWATLKEPRASARTPVLAERAVDQPSLQEVCATLWANRTFRQLVIFYSLISFLGNGISQWLPAFFIRSYGLGTGELGTWLAALYGVGGAIGAYLGGEWASRHATGNERLQLRVMTAVYLVFGVITAFVYLASSKYYAFALKGLGVIVFYTTLGPLLAMVQTLVPDRIRATSIAIFYLCANLIGVGLGPLAVGALSDLLRPWAAEESLRFALLAICPGYLFSVWYVWRASYTASSDLKPVET